MPAALIPMIPTVLLGPGGILDRIDSPLFSALLAYYYVPFFLMRAH